MSKTAILTIVSNNYLAHAATIMRSLSVTNPDYRRFLILSDEPNGSEKRFGDLFEVVPSSSVGMSHYMDHSIRYDVMEFNTAVKPSAIRWIFDNFDVDHVIYIDPDTYAYRKFSELDAILSGGCSMVLTPHITAPLEDGFLPDDHSMLQAGVFNLGFIAVSRTREALDYLDWWARMLATKCYSDIRNALFTDQKWCDLAPCFIDDLAILKNPAYNVAYWNLSQRALSHDDTGNALINGQPLAFFHFSGLQLDKERVVSKHQDRLRWNMIGGFREIFSHYRQELLNHGWAEFSKIGYAYDHFGDMKIARVIRQFYRDAFPVSQDDALFTPDFFVRLCNTPSKWTAKGDAVRITALLAFIHGQRPDLQQAFNLSSPQGRAAFAHWFEANGPREYGLDTRFVRQQHIQDLTANTPSPVPPPIFHPGRSPSYRRWRKIRRAVLNVLGRP